MGKAQCEGKEQEPGELDSQLRQCSGWQSTAGLGSAGQPGKAQGQIHCLSGTSQVGQWLSIPLAAQFLSLWLFLDIRVTPRNEELEDITPHTWEKGFSARLVWDNKQFSHSNLIWPPGPLPSRDSVQGCLCLSPHCGGTTASHDRPWGFPGVWRRLLCAGGISWTPWAGRTLPGKGQAGLSLGGRMDFSGERGLGEGQRLSMKNSDKSGTYCRTRLLQRLMRTCPIHQVVGEELGVGCGAGLGSSSFFHTVQLLCAPRTWGRGCQAGLEAQAQQPELTPGQHRECWKETALQKLSAGQTNPSHQRQEMPCTKAN